jgi:hypothetical protein
MEIKMAKSKSSYKLPSKTKFMRVFDLCDVGELRYSLPTPKPGARDYWAKCHAQAMRYVNEGLLQVVKADHPRYTGFAVTEAGQAYCRAHLPRGA